MIVASTSLHLLAEQFGCVDTVRRLINRHRDERASYRRALRIVDQPIKGGRRTTAEVEADRAERQQARAQALTERADQQTADALAAHEHTRELADQIPHSGDPARLCMTEQCPDCDVSGGSSDLGVPQLRARGNSILPYIEPGPERPKVGPKGG